MIYQLYLIPGFFVPWFFLKLEYAKNINQMFITAIICTNLFRDGWADDCLCDDVAVVAFAMDLSAREEEDEEEDGCT